MNPIERIEIWQRHLATNQGLMDEFDSAYPGAPESMRAKVRANLADSIRNCEENIAWWSEQVAA